MISTWMKERLLHLQNNTNKTVGIVVNHNEIKENKIDFLAHLTQSKEFRQDLNMNKSYWFYL